MTNFFDVFSDFLEINNITVQDVSRATGIEDSVIYNYANNALPTVKHAVSIANYMNCSLNYLMGIDDLPNKASFEQKYDISVFSKRYDNLLKEYNVSHYNLSTNAGLNYSSHYAWRHGAIPAMTSLIKIAKYFDVSIDYLVGRSDKK